MSHLRIDSAHGEEYLATLNYEIVDGLVWNESFLTFDRRYTLKNSYGLENDETSIRRAIKRMLRKIIFKQIMKIPFYLMYKTCLQKRKRKLIWLAPFRLTFPDTGKYSAILHDENFYIEDAFRYFEFEIKKFDIKANHFVYTLVQIIENKLLNLSHKPCNESEDYSFRMCYKVMIWYTSW